MDYEEFYGKEYLRLKKAEQQINMLIKSYSEETEATDDERTIRYCYSRIKNPESMKAKLEQKKLTIDLYSALNQVYDAVGIRIICSFADDIYKIVSWIRTEKQVEIILEKDYISKPKPNGYRSYHVIIKILQGECKGIYVEIQIRTIAEDFWATIEHQIKYKHKIKNEKLIVSELKKCADTIASVDLSMQTIKDIIKQGEES